MAKEEKNKLENNENVSWGSQFTAGRNIRIGNSSIHFNIGLNRALLGLVVFLSSLLYFTAGFPGQGGTHSSKPIVEPIDTTEERKTFSPPLPLDKKEKINTEKPIEEAGINTVNLSFTDTESNLQKIAKTYVSRQLRQQNIEVQNNGQERIACQISTQREDVELGIRSTIYLTFQVNVDHYAASGGLVESHTIASDRLIRYHEEEIPKAFSTWLQEEQPQLLPQSIIHTNK